MTTLSEQFYWGNSTSSMQTEGGWNEGGKGKSVYDVRENKIWETAIDNFHDFDTDFDLMKEMNMKMYRFQISWSRVNPDGDGDFNEAGIEFYSKMIDGLLARGIEPMICLYHFDMPFNLAEKYDGFLSRHVKDAFVRFGKEMIDRFADKVKYWIVFNEHNLYFTPSNYYYSGQISHTDLTDDEIYTVFHHTMLAHAEIADYIHQTTNAQIGGMLAYTQVYPATKSPKDNLITRKVNEFNYWNLCSVYAFGKYSAEVLAEVENRKINMDWQAGDDEILSKGISDFISFSYYRSHLCNSEKINLEQSAVRYLDEGFELDENLLANEWNWAIDADGFRFALTEIYNRFHLPVFPIENGIGWREQFDGKEIQDDYRIDYHRSHIKALKDAVKFDGVNVLGYLAWGLIDIPASSGDIEKRYGAVYVDYENLQRIPKKSFHFIQETFGSNGENIV